MVSLVLDEAISSFRSEDQTTFVGDSTFEIRQNSFKSNGTGSQAKEPQWKIYSK